MSYLLLSRHNYNFEDFFFFSFIKTAYCRLKVLASCHFWKFLFYFKSYYLSSTSYITTLFELAVFFIWSFSLFYVSHVSCTKCIIFIAVLYFFHPTVCVLYTQGVETKQWREVSVHPITHIRQSKKWKKKKKLILSN